MTTEEKLQHFYDVSVGEAKNEAAQLVETHKKELDQQFEEYKQQKDRETETLLKAETDNASREINKALSASQLDIKRNWTKKQNELKDQLFEKVQALLTEFKASPKYESWLADKIKAALDFAQNDEISIFLAPCDQDKQEALSKSTGAAIQISDQDFMGGIRARIPGKNILIDNSFQSAFQNEKHKFTFDGGLSNE